jgi:hypothetical protein
MKLKKAQALLATISRSSANAKIYDEIVKKISDVENDIKNESSLRSLEGDIKTCIFLDKSESEQAVIVEEIKEKKSRAADMAKSRAKAAGYIRDARLSEKAAKSLESLSMEWNMTRTQVINKLLEEQEQLKLL